nr:hypothetical protein [Petropleomorpha daqingensis]
MWSPLRDVDPRVGEHLLDVLYDAGIAAYLEPAADVGPYTRTVFLPSPPSDRLFVDRAHRTEARALVDAHADEHARGQVPERARVRRDLDEDAEWARIVAAFEAEHGQMTVEESPAETPPPAPAEPDVLDRPDEHFEPPPPPKVPVPKPSTLYSFLLVAAGLVLIWAPSVIGLSDDLGLVLGFAAVAGGVGTAVSRMRDRSTDDGDDGAVV